MRKTAQISSVDSLFSLFPRFSPLSHEVCLVLSLFTGYIKQLFQHFYLETSSGEDVLDSGCCGDCSGECSVWKGKKNEPLKKL